MGPAVSALRAHARHLALGNCFHGKSSSVRNKGVYDVRVGLIEVFHVFWGPAYSTGKRIRVGTGFEFGLINEGSREREQNLRMYQQKTNLEME